MNNMTNNSLNSQNETEQETVCSACGGLCEARCITLTLRRAINAFVMVRNVPADVCQDCGESQFSLWTAGRLTSAMRLQRAPDDVAIIPIYDFPLAS